MMTILTNSTWLVAEERRRILALLNTIILLMASLDPYDDDGYSDDEEEEDWPDTDIIGGAMANLNKDHRVKSSQMSEVVSVREFKNLCTESIQSVADGTYDQVKSNETRLSTACELGLTVPELAKLKDELE